MLAAGRSVIVIGKCEENFVKIAAMASAALRKHCRSFEILFSLEGRRDSEQSESARDNGTEDKREEEDDKRIVHEISLASATSS